MFKKPPMSVPISSPASRELRVSVPELEKEMKLWRFPLILLPFPFFLSPEMIWCEVISRTVRLHDTTLTKNKSEAKCSVTRVPGVNFGTTFKCALFLQELISMHWWPRITTANYGNMPGYRADPILQAAPTCPLQTWNKLIYFRGKVWGRSFYFYLGLSGT